MYRGWETTGGDGSPKEFPDHFDDPDMTPDDLDKRKTELEIWSDEIKQISFILIRYKYIYNEDENTEELKKKIILAEKLKNDFVDFIKQMSYYHKETIDQKTTLSDIRTRFTMVKNVYNEFSSETESNDGNKINSNKRRRTRFQLLNKIKF